MNRRLLASLLTAAFAASALAEPPRVEPTTTPAVPVESTTGPSASDADIEALAKQLDSKDPAAVAQARGKLLAIGERAKPALERKLRAQSAAADVLVSLASKQFTAPTLITLKLTDATPAEAVEALSKAVGVSLKPRGRAYDSSAATSKITCAVTDQPFWTVVRTICDQGQLALSPNPSEGNVFSIAPKFTVGQSAMRSPVSVNGSCLIAMNSLGRNVQIDMQTLQPIKSPINVGFELWFEPKVKPVSVSRAVAIDEAVDDQGNSLITKTNYGASGFGDATRGTGPLRTNLMLDYPAENPGKRIKILRGKINVTVGVGEQKEDLSDVLAGKEVTKNDVDGKSYTFSNFKKQGTRSFNLRVAAPPEAHGASGISIIATDDAGHTFIQAGGGMMRSGPRGQEYSISLQPPVDENGQMIEGPPTKLTWVYPLKTQEVPISFEFKDLPLP